MRKNARPRRLPHVTSQEQHFFYVLFVIKRFLKYDLFLLQTFYLWPKDLRQSKMNFLLLLLVLQCTSLVNSKKYLLVKLNQDDSEGQADFTATTAGDTETKTSFLPSIKPEEQRETTIHWMANYTQPSVPNNFNENSFFPLDTTGRPKGLGDNGLPYETQPGLKGVSEVPEDHDGIDIGRGQQPVLANSIPHFPGFLEGTGNQLGPKKTMPEYLGNLHEFENEGKFQEPLDENKLPGQASEESLENMFPWAHGNKNSIFGDSDNQPKKLFRGRGE